MSEPLPPTPVNPRSARPRHPPRRRFHALHADVLLVLALVAALAAALPAMRVAGPVRPGPHPFSAAVAETGAEAGETAASPLLFAFGAVPDPARTPVPDVPPPGEPDILRRPAWTPDLAAAPGPGAGGAGADGPAPPVFSLLADLNPATPLFSEERPVPPAPPEAGPAPKVSVERFRSAPDAPPVAFVDAPGADPAGLRKLETEAYAGKR